MGNSGLFFKPHCEVSPMCCMALNHVCVLVYGLSEYEYVSDYVPNIAKCHPLSLSDIVNPVLEVLS